MFKAILVFLSLLFYSTFVAAKTDIRIRDTTFAYGGNSASTANQELTFELPSDGSSIDQPHRIYIPVDSGGGVQDNTILTKTNLPAAGGNSGFVKFTVTVDTDVSITYYLKAAVAQNTNSTTSSSDWEVINIYNTSGGTTGFSDISSKDYTALLDIGEICDVAGMCTGTDFEDNRKVYIFMTASSNTAGDTIKPEDVTGGTFIDVFLSDKVPTPAPTLSSVNKGDQQIVVNYSGTYAENEFQGVVACLAPENTCNNIPSASTDPDLPIQTAISGGNCSLQSEIYNPIVSGSISINELTNDLQYEVAVAYLNKYKFASILSNSENCTTPKEIQVLLEENQCYLLTAGFGHNHKVIDYFRMIRDHYLAKFSLGKWFIQQYYATAPAYTGYIMKTPIIAATIRGFAWSLYFVFNHLWMSLGALATLSLVPVYISRRKRP